MPGMKQIQVAELRIDQRLRSHMDQEKGIDISEYIWINLGFVCYGMQNDVGYTRQYVKLGIKRKKNMAVRHNLVNKPQVVEVMTKYYSLDGNHNYEEYEMLKSPRDEPHDQDLTYYKCPRNFSGIIETIIGEDKRTFIASEDY